MILRPFFSFFGSKWGLAKSYSKPTYPTIIESFAGSAGYSLLHHTLNIKLFDIDPVIVSVWNYLIKVTPDEIMRLPMEVAHVDDIKGPQEAKWLVGFWLARCGSSPRLTPTTWARSGKFPYSFWGPSIRERISRQVPHIRHWQVSHSSYENIPNEPATWFIDPPYTKMGKHYRCNSIDYIDLGVWCKGRLGQVIACEGSDTSWLPFNKSLPVALHKALLVGKQREEYVFEQG